MEKTTEPVPVDHLTFDTFVAGDPLTSNQPAIPEQDLENTTCKES